MPIYEYECKKCSFRFELKRGFHDGEQAICPRCHGEAHRIFSPVPIIFKGSGFYVTDSRNTPKDAPNKGKAESSQETEKTNQGKS